MKEIKTLNLKVPLSAHSSLKIFAAQKSINLTDFAANVIVQAAENKTLLEKAAQETLKNNV